ALPYCNLRQLYPEASLVLDGADSEKYSCLVCQVVVHQPTAASMMMYTAISIERYIAITRPFSYPDIFTMKKVRISIICSWIYSYFMFIGLSCFNIWTPGLQCSLSMILYQPAAFYGIIASAGILMLIIICTAYCRIFYIAWAHKKQQNEQQNAIGPVTDTSKSDMKIVKMMAIIFGTLVILYTPYWIFTCVVLFYKQKPKWLVTYEQFSVIMYYCNSFCNSFVYGWKSTDFRRALRMLVFRQNSV
ncbi:unnamed protein product, partial [Owenia fusiformis]